MATCNQCGKEWDDDLDPIIGFHLSSNGVEQTDEESFTNHLFTRCNINSCPACDPVKRWIDIKQNKPYDQQWVETLSKINKEECDGLDTPDALVWATGLWVDDNNDSIVVDGENQDWQTIVYWRACKPSTLIMQAIQDRNECILDMAKAMRIFVFAEKDTHEHFKQIGIDPTDAEIIMFRSSLVSSSIYEFASKIYNKHVNMKTGLPSLCDNDTMPIDKD